MASAPLPETDIYDDDDDEEAEPAAEANAEVLDRALTRFDSVASPQQELRAQALQARRFVTIPGAMWEGAWLLQWENVPRPEVDKITKSLEKIETDYRQNRITASYVPASEDADQETAETLEAMHRADSDHFKAMQARDNAFQEGIRGGFGAWRLCTDYEDEYDPANDRQRINPGFTIADADQSVYFDGSSKLYDKSDAMWAFVITAWTRLSAQQKWGENIAAWPMQQWKYAWDWYTPDIVRIAEYYEIEFPDDRLIALTNPMTDEEQRFFRSEVEAGEISDLVSQGWKKSERKIKRRRVHKYVMNGTAILKDCGFIAGPNIPIVPFYGRRDYVDNMERFRGHVHKKMDRQRIYNASVSNVLETQSLSPFQVPIVDPDQVDTVILDQWARGNIDRTPLRLLKALRNPDGSYATTGPVGKIEPPEVQPATAALLQIASTDLTDDDENADEVKANTSAEAMDIAATRVDLKSAIYLDNMRQSVQREAEIYREMSREVYFETGRKVETLTMDGKSGTATLGEPHIDQNGVYRIRNDLTQGKYKVVATVQEATDTQRQKTVRQNLGLAEMAAQINDQELGQVALLVAMMNQDGEGAHETRKYARNKLIALGVVEPTPEEKRQLEQAAEQQQQPSAAEQALNAQAGELQTRAQLNQASAAQKMADAHLKVAQAEAVGGPDKAPDVPSGLSAPEAADKIATANLKDAQAAKIHHDIRDGKVRTVADLHQRQQEIEIARRAQDLAERQPQGNA